MTRRWTLSAWLLIGFVLGGCMATPPSDSDNGDGGNQNEMPPDDNGGGNGDTNVNVSLVQLVATNVNPGVGEQVALLCLPTAALDEGAVYAFQPNSGRLIVDSTRGLATFIIDQTDVGAELAFTCTVTTEAGTSPDSNEVTIIPTG